MHPAHHLRPLRAWAHSAWALALLAGCGHPPPGAAPSGQLEAHAGWHPAEPQPLVQGKQQAPVTIHFSHTEGQVQIDIMLLQEARELTVQILALEGLGMQLQPALAPLAPILPGGTHLQVVAHLDPQAPYGHLSVAVQGIFAGRSSGKVSSLRLSPPAPSASLQKGGYEADAAAAPSPPQRADAPYHLLPAQQQPRPAVPGAASAPGEQGLGASGEAPSR